MIGSRLQPGDQLGGYRVERALHAGGNGYIYDVVPATAPDPGFPLVMKVPGIGRGEPTIGIVSFEIEQMIQPTLSGPHVPRYVASGDSALPWLVMERIVGDALAPIVERAPLPVADVAAIGAGLATAVHAVHRQDVVHLDIKPENFLRRATGEWVLLDYGFSRHARFPDLLAEERHHNAGSAAYVSPEQVSGDRSDPRSDVFALGVLLYQLATGELPFGEPQTIGGWSDRLWRAPVPPRARNPEVPPWLQEVILHALEVDASRRYATAAHVAFDLRHPETVALTARAHRVDAEGVIAQFGAWWRSRHRDSSSPRRPSARTPVVLVAVDTENPDDERHPALREATRAILAVSDDFRLMFVSVIGAAPVGEGDTPEETDSGRMLAHRQRLRHWVEPLRLPSSRQSLHVIAASEPAGTILELAAANHVDLIVLGAPDPEARTLAWWRSAASTVSANAHCSVHLVRVPRR
jgi:serine/threonine protein kinase